MRDVLHTLIHYLTQAGNALYELTGNRIYVVTNVPADFVNTEPALVLVRRSGATDSTAPIDRSSIQFTAFGGEDSNGNRTLALADAVHRALVDRLNGIHGIEVLAADATILGAALTYTADGIEPETGWPRVISFWNVITRDR